MLEPIWLSAACAQPLVLTAAQARAVWQALHPAADHPVNGPQAAPPTLMRMRAQQLLELALRCSEPMGDGREAGAACCQDNSADLRSAIRTWQLHRRAAGLPAGASHVAPAVLQLLRLALRGSWPAWASSGHAVLPGFDASTPAASGSASRSDG